MRVPIFPGKASLLLAGPTFLGACGGGPDPFDRWRACLASGSGTVGAPLELAEPVREWCDRLSSFGSFPFALAPSPGIRDPVVAVEVLGGTDVTAGPLTASRSGFAIAGEGFEDPTDVALVAWAALEDRSPPVRILGRDPRVLGDLLPSIDLPSRPCIRIYRNGEIEREWDLGARGRVDGKKGRRPAASLELFAGRASSDFRAEGSSSGPDVRLALLRPADAPGKAGDPPNGFTSSILDALGRVEALAGRTAERPFVVFAHGHPEDKAVATGDPRAAHANFVARRVHAVEAEEFRGEAAAEVARLAARTLLGKPAEPWLETGLAAACSGTRLGLPIEETGALLKSAGAAATLDDLRHPGRSRRLSPLRVEASAAALVAGLLESAKDRFLRLYRGEGSPWTDAELERHLEERLERSVRERPPRRERALGGFAQGVLLAGPAGSPAGFGSRSVERSLERLLTAGAPWVGFRPAAPLRGSWRGTGVAFDPAEGAVGEPEALVWAARRARAHGLRVAIGPPLFGAAAAGRWLDAVSNGTPPWPAYVGGRLFDAAVHYAIVAEAAQADLLLLGGAADDRTDEWRSALAAGRALFSGPIAFCPARWTAWNGVPSTGPVEFLGASLPWAADLAEDPSALVRRAAQSALANRALAILLESESAVPGTGERFVEKASLLLGAARREPGVALVLWGAGSVSGEGSSGRRGPRPVDLERLLSLEVSGADERPR